MDDLLWVPQLLGVLAVPVAVGFVVVQAARRWPGLVLAVLGLVLAAGVGLLASASASATRDDPAGGWRWLRVGAMVLAGGLPAVMLVMAARLRRDGPITRAEWGNVLFGYLFFCIVLAFLARVVIALGATPSGRFR